MNAKETYGAARLVKHNHIKKNQEREKSIQQLIKAKVVSKSREYIDKYSQRVSQRRTVLSPDAVANKSECLGSQHSWSTLSVCPFNSMSFALLCSHKSPLLANKNLRSQVIRKERVQLRQLLRKIPYMTMRLNMPDSCSLIHRARRQLFARTVPCH